MTLAEARKKTGMTLDDVARALHMAASAVQHRETGLTSMTLDDLIVFANLYGVRAHDIEVVPAKYYCVRR